MFTRKISKFISQMETVFRQFGIDLRKTIEGLVGIPYFLKTAYRYSNMAKGSDFPFEIRNVRPMLQDRGTQAGEINKQYFFQDIWAARKIHFARPKRHVDIGSSVGGFVAHVLCFMPVEVVDIRPLQASIVGLKFVQEDATNLGRFDSNSVESLSSLHAIEHFGLGRYGDPLSHDAYLKAMRSLARILLPGGSLYFSVPIGKQRVQFNSQRIFSPLTVLQIFSDLRLVSFSVVNDLGQYIENTRPEHFTDLNCGCGLFELTK